MPTDIHFVVNDMFRVKEEPSQVAQAFRGAEGPPFRLTDHEGGGDVYVNPVTVAFWTAASG